MNYEYNIFDDQYFYLGSPTELIESSLSEKAVNFLVSTSIVKVYWDRVYQAKAIKLTRESINRFGIVFEERLKQRVFSTIGGRTHELFAKELETLKMIEGEIKSKFSVGASQIYRSTYKRKWSANWDRCYYLEIRLKQVSGLFDDVLENEILNNELAEFLESLSAHTEQLVFSDRLGLKFFKELFPIIPKDWSPFKTSAVQY